VTAAAPAPTAPTPATPVDPRRWITLGIVLLALIITALDNTILTVAIPTIQRDLHTDLSNLQWVLTGYSLTFATLLVIGGRLGDVYGARTMFIVGAALFGVGSFVASISHSLPLLLLGESLIEGIGASLMLPATLAIISNTFVGRERVQAFAAWGALAGASAAFGPGVGGWLTSDYSWRWAFRINLVVAPVAAIGALLFIRPTPRAAQRQRIDVPGAVLVALGTFFLVFGLSEGGRYGWWEPLRTFSVHGHALWPASRPVSPAPVAFALAVILLVGFWRWERSRSTSGRDPLFEFALLRHPSFRYGLLTTAVLAMGQLGFLFVFPVFLQDGRHLSALESGLWLVPLGLFIMLGAQVGARLNRWIGTVRVVRAGLVLEAVGLCVLALVISPDLGLGAVIPAFAVFGMGLGFASSQLTNVVLSDIPHGHAGAASGANTTVRQIGAALGIATVGSLLTTLTLRRAVSGVASSTLPASVRATADTRLHEVGVGFTPPAGTSAADAATLRHILDGAVAHGARPALLFAALVVSAGAALSFLIPRDAADEGDERAAEPAGAIAAH
jgi:EmrB/QacA subfamily drug resistance transporter